MSQRLPEIRALPRLLARYREPDSARGVFELVITAVPFLIIWVLIQNALDHGYWAGLLLEVPAAGLLVRLFMIQHDCGHGSFFRSRVANDWVGRAIGVMTLTPYDYWRHNHARHHASSGNLDHRGLGDIDTLTVREFLAQSRWRRMRYRLYRHPMVMFGVGPTYLFVLKHRLPVGLMRGGWKPWLSTMGTNTAIAVLVVAMIRLVGYGPRTGPMAKTGVFTKLHCMAVPITTCRSSCDGSRQISVSTTSIICAVGFPAIDCRTCCGTIRNSLASDE
jgi:omega-6 fatty acid desaturase (delta-12 desaturase)